MNLTAKQIATATKIAALQQSARDDVDTARYLTDRAREKQEKAKEMIDKIRNEDNNEDK